MSTKVWPIVAVAIGGGLLVVDVQTLLHDVTLGSVARVFADMFLLHFAGQRLKHKSKTVRL
jgi:hypothetical protein